MLGSKMLKQAFGVAYMDIRIGPEVPTRTALDDGFASKSGKHFDNNSGQFTSRHPDTLDLRKSQEIVTVIESVFGEPRQ